MIKRISFLFLLIVFSFYGLVLAAPNEIKGKHFIVRYDTEHDFAQKVLNRAESEYDRIAKNLGYSRYDKYWSFKDRCTLYIYADKESYVRSRPGIPDWSAGYAEYDTRTISGFRGSDKFLSTVLPHEITHLIFNDYVRSQANIPKWFLEGVALSQEEKVRKNFLEQVGKALYQHYFIPIYLLTDESYKGVHSYQYTYLAYAEAALLVDFLISSYGNERFVKFCRELREGNSFVQAFEAAYRGTLASVEDLETQFTTKFSVDGRY